MSVSLKVRTAALNHPNGATGYRIDHEGRSICYITDTEHVPGKIDRNILDLPPERISDASVDLTVFEGRVVYRRSPGS